MRRSKSLPRLYRRKCLVHKKSRSFFSKLEWFRNDQSSRLASTTTSKWCQQHNRRFRPGSRDISKPPGFWFGLPVRSGGPINLDVGCRKIQPARNPPCELTSAALGRVPPTECDVSVSINSRIDIAGSQLLERREPLQRAKRGRGLNIKFAISDQQGRSSSRA